MVILKSKYFGLKDLASWKTLSLSRIGFPMAARSSQTYLNFLKNSLSLMFSFLRE